MIAGKTDSEILAMVNDKRYRWYKTLSPEEKEGAMRTVETARRAKISKNNSMKRPEVRAKLSASLTGRIFSKQWKTKLSVAMTGKTRSKESRAKQSASTMGERNHNYGKTISEEQKAKQSAVMMGRTASEETKAKLSAVRMGEKNHFFGKTHSEESNAKNRAAHIGKIFSKEHRAKLSATQTGKNNHQWQGGISFEPYCPAFNDQLKEKIRNRDNRTCVLCGKGEIQNGERLSVHHIDADKMQGCNGKSWYLCALCNSCNSRPDTVEKEFLIVTGGRPVQ